MRRGGQGRENVGRCVGGVGGLRQVGGGGGGGP